MGKPPAFQFYVGDWLRDPQLRQASFATRGIWIDMLAYMWTAPDPGRLSGTVKGLARMIGCTIPEMETFISEAQGCKFAEVEIVPTQQNVTCNANVTKCNGAGNANVTVTNRRMFRDAKDRENIRLRVQKHRQKKPCNGIVTGDVTLPSSSSSSSSKIFLSDSDEIRLSELLFQLMVENNPGAKKPNFQTWAKDIDKMLRIDKRTPEEIDMVIRWSQKDGFWFKNILSTSKLRKQFDQMWLKIQKEPNTKRGKTPEDILNGTWDGSRGS